MDKKHGGIAFILAFLASKLLPFVVKKDNENLHFLLSMMLKNKVMYCVGSFQLKEFIITKNLT